jgi:hypothetical protein
MRTMNSSIAPPFIGGCSMSVLDQGNQGQEEKCPSGTGRVEKETKKRG